MLILAWFAVCSCQNIVLLTGTPLQNNLHELYALLNFMHPDIFTTSEPFDEAFDLTKNRYRAFNIFQSPLTFLSCFELGDCLPGRPNMVYFESRVDNDALEAAHRLIQPICLRRLKEDVEKSLPARVGCSFRRSVIESAIFAATIKFEAHLPCNLLLWYSTGAHPYLRERS